MGKFWILAGIAALAYFAYGRHSAPPTAQPQAALQQLGSGTPKQEGQYLEASHPSYYGTMEAGGPVLRLKPEIAAGLANLSTAQVVMFATSWCPYCAKARKVFAQNRVPYVELDIERDARAKRFMEETMGVSGFPTIVIGNRVLLGFDEAAILAGLQAL